MQGKRILLGLTMFALAAPVLASQMSVPYGWYIEGNAGSSRLSDFSLPGKISSSGIGGNVNLGYKFMPYVGAEIGYSRYSGIGIKNSVGTKAAEGKIYSYDIAVRGILPVSDSGFEAFAKVGAQRITNRITIDDQAAATQLGIGSGSHSSTGLYLGLGGQYYVMPELAIVVQWQRAKGSSSTGTEDLISAGLSFIFV